MPSQIKNPKLPEWFTDLKKDFIGDLIQRSDGYTYQIYDIQGKLIYLHDPEILTPCYFQLTIITQDQFLNEFKTL